VVDGPIPGTCCDSSAVAVLRFTGCNGGFLFPAKTAMLTKTVASATIPAAHRKERLRFAAGHN
jgi:hypothetical protein